MPRASHLATREERAAATVDARRSARFKYAGERIEKIANGEPQLTPEQRRDLALRLLPEDDYIRDLVAAWPPLSPKQRTQIVALLAPTQDEAAAA